MWRVTNDKGSWSGADRPGAYHADRSCGYLPVPGSPGVVETDEGEASRLGLEPCPRCVTGEGTGGGLDGRSECPLCGAEVAQLADHLPACDGA